MYAKVIDYDVIYHFQTVTVSFHSGQVYISLEMGAFFIRMFLS